MTGDGQDAAPRTNSIQEIYEVLGVEAARHVIMDEASRTLDEQGLTVDIRHIMLVADLMTTDGDVKAIGRHGISGRQIERPGQGGLRDHRGPPAACGADGRRGPPGRGCRKHYSRATGYARYRGCQFGIFPR